MVDQGFFEFLKEWSLGKISLVAQKPVYANFLLSVSNLPERLMIKESFSNSVNILYEKIKTVKLRKDINYQDAMIFVKAVFDDLGEYYLNQYHNKTKQILENLDKTKAQTDKILEMLKFGVIEK